MSKVRGLFDRKTGKLTLDNMTAEEQKEFLRKWQENLQVFWDRSLSESHGYQPKSDVTEPREQKKFIPPTGGTGETLREKGVLEQRISTQSETITHLQNQLKQLSELNRRLQRFATIQLYQAKLLGDEATMKVYKRVVENGEGL